MCNIRIDRLQWKNVKICHLQFVVSVVRESANCRADRVAIPDSHWSSSCCPTLSLVSTYCGHFRELSVVSFSGMHYENRPYYSIERTPFQNVVAIANANESIPTKSANPYPWRTTLALALRSREWALGIEWFPPRWWPSCLKHPAKKKKIHFRTHIMEKSNHLSRNPTPTINFFFWRSLSLHKNTTADLKTKHIAWSSSPFFILPKKSDIFSHSTPP